MVKKIFHSEYGLFFIAIALIVINGGLAFGGVYPMWVGMFNYLIAFLPLARRIKWPQRDIHKVSKRMFARLMDPKSSPLFMAPPGLIDELLVLKTAAQVYEEDDHPDSKKIVMMCEEKFNKKLDDYVRQKESNRSNIKSLSV